MLELAGVCLCVCVCVCVTKRQSGKGLKREREREREVQCLVFPWVYCSNIVILINIYLPGKVERMISLRVCVCVCVCVYVCAACTSSLSEQPLVHVRVYIAYYSIQHMN